MAHSIDVDNYHGAAQYPAHLEPEEGAVDLYGPTREPFTGYSAADISHAASVGSTAARGFGLGADVISPITHVQNGYGGPSAYSYGDSVGARFL